MTLYKQLSAFITIIFLLVVVGLSWGQLNEARNFLYRQMQSELDNSSQALSLMLQPAMEQADKIGAEALTTAMFEGGFYQQIKLKWLADGSEQVWHHNQVDVSTPAWFKQLPLFEAPTRTTTIVSGWLQLGELEITAHPGYGYRQIWHSAVTTIIIVAIMMALMLTLAKYWLKRILRPLEQVQQRAEKVASKQFGKAMTEPKTAELANLVRSINAMESQLERQFDAHKSQVNTLQQSLLTDRVANLPNRNYMQGRIASWLHEMSDGALVLAEVPLLEQVRQQFGYQLRDELIERLGAELKQLSPAGNVIASRISANEFLILGEDLEPMQQEQLGQQVQNLLHQFEQSCGIDNPIPCVAGAVSRNLNEQQQEVLAQADQAMRQAKQQQQGFAWYKNLQQQLLSSQQWRKLLGDGLSKRLQLHGQPVLGWDSRQPIHHELFGRIHHNGNEYYAGQFWPYLNTFNRCVAFDQAVIEAALVHLDQQTDPLPLAINLTSASILNNDFILWLLNRLGQANYPLKFEIAEATAIDNCAQLQQFRAQLKRLGYAFGVDHFGRELASLDYLQQLLPDYVRLDHAFGGSDSAQSQQLCRALCLTAQGLQIEVYLTGVEQQEQLEPFHGFELSGYQGFIAPPQRLGQSERAEII